MRSPTEVRIVCRLCISLCPSLWFQSSENPGRCETFIAIRSGANRVCISDVEYCTSQGSRMDQQLLSAHSRF